MKRLRVLVVDDEKPARERLRRLIARDPRLELVDVCSSGVDALRTVRDLPVSAAIDILCLDIQMPEMDGFALLSALVAESSTRQLPVAIFVTAHDEFAIKAFESRAVDYLLKPFSDERFEAAVDEAVRRARSRDAAAVLAQMQALLGAPQPQSAGPDPNVGRNDTSPRVDKMVVKSAHRVRLVPVEQIAWIEAEGMYVNIHTRDGATHLHRGAIGSLEEALDGRQFVRIHRSAIVNIDLVHELRQNSHGDYVTVLRDRTEIRVGRRFRDRLQSRLGQSL